jgi:hypothetical protein
VASGVDSVIFSPEVVGGIMYLHCLNRVDSVVGYDDGVALLVREAVVTMANI